MVGFFVRQSYGYCVCMCVYACVCEGGGLLVATLDWAATQSACANTWQAGQLTTQLASTVSAAVAVQCGQRWGCGTRAPARLVAKAGGLAAAGCCCCVGACAGVVVFGLGCGLVTGCAEIAAVAVAACNGGAALPAWVLWRHPAAQTCTP